MKRKLLFTSFLLILSFLNGFSQCGKEVTLTICDITQIDKNNDGTPDGIINLYDEYKKLTGKDIEKGTWFDPERYFALSENASGDLNIWNLPNATNNEKTMYHFKLFNSKCGKDTPALIFKIRLGAFSGYTAKIVNTNDVNIQFCYTKEKQLCNKIPGFDLNLALSPKPGAHKNGIWKYLGSSPNFKKLDGNIFYATIPYEPYGSIIDRDFFEFKYTVAGATPCAPSMVTYVKVSVVRSVSAGVANTVRICEDDLKSNNYANDIDLTDDAYLVKEDLEGKWLYQEDNTKQLTSYTDSKINLKKLYDSIYQKKPRFENVEFSYKYAVDNRSLICGSDVSEVKFIFLEKIRPFKAKKELTFCIGDKELKNIDLYSLLEFTTENGVLYDYPENRLSNYWKLISAPINAKRLEEIDQRWELGSNYTAKGALNLHTLNNQEAGEYIFEYRVGTGYNMDKNDETTLHSSPLQLCQPEIIPGECEKTETARVKIIIKANTYPGKDTKNLELCNSNFKKPVNLFDLLEKNEKISTNGEWTDLDTQKTIDNPFTLEDFNTTEKSFNFKYTTKAQDSCNHSSLLSFKVFKQKKSGTGGTVSICKSGKPTNLFNLLKDNPSKEGSWTLPDNSTSPYNLVIDPKTANSGIYTYTSDDLIGTNGKVLCQGATTTINLKITTPNSGENTNLEFCETELSKPIQLISLLKTDPSKGEILKDGVWKNTENPNETNDGTFTLQKLNTNKQTFNFTYTVTDKKGCVNSSILIFTVYKKPYAGKTNTLNICKSQTSVNLFSLLGKNIYDKGFWTLPDGTKTTTSTLEINPSEIKESTLKYTYTTPKNGTCQGGSVILTLNFIDFSVGKDTIGLEFCETDLNRPLNLFSLLEKEYPKTTISTGSWKDTNSGKTIPNLFTITNADLKAEKQVFNFEYSATVNECTKTANLSFTVHKRNFAGKDTTKKICSVDSPFEAIKELGENVSKNGTWVLPNGEKFDDYNLIINPSIAQEGNYVYITKPLIAKDGVKLCDGVKSVLLLNITQLYAGENTTDLKFCESEFPKPISLFSLLKKHSYKSTITIDGVWKNTDNGKTITEQFVLPKINTEKQTFNFEYTASVKDCKTTAQLSFTVYKRNFAGEDSSKTVCTITPPFKAIEKLGKDISENGTWVLPNGETFDSFDLVIDPSKAEEGKYIYKTNAVTSDGKTLCQGSEAELLLSIVNLYTGEDTTDLEFCETDFSKPVNLFSLLKKDSNKSTININGTWKNTDTGKNISKEFTLPPIDSKSNKFNFEYTVTTENCSKTTKLSFIVYKKPTAGISIKKTYCSDDITEIDLSNFLTENISKKGIWTLPDNSEKTIFNLIIKPKDAIAGKYTYTIPPIKGSNGEVLCATTPNEIEIVTQDKPLAGEDVEKDICYSEKELDLYTLLNNSNTKEGSFYNAENQKLNSSIINISEIPNKTSVAFTYKIDDNTICKGDASTIKINLYGPKKPKAKNQSFCAAKKPPLVEDLKAEGANNYQWYGTNEATTPLPLDTILLDGEDYFVATTDDTGCSSKRTKILVTYIPIGSENCEPCIADGISDNGDNINNVLDLCNLPNLFPEYTMEIYNRLGILVYKGEKGVPLFNGSSNVPNYVGGNGRLPTGVYFYIFYPNDTKTKPIQSDFYLGR